MLPPGNVSSCTALRSTFTITYKLNESELEYAVVMFDCRRGAGSSVYVRKQASDTKWFTCSRQVEAILDWEEAPWLEP